MLLLFAGESIVCKSNSLPFFSGWSWISSLPHFSSLSTLPFTSFVSHAAFGCWRSIESKNPRCVFLSVFLTRLTWWCERKKNQDKEDCYLTSKSPVLYSLITTTHHSKYEVLSGYCVIMVTYFCFFFIAHQRQWANSASAIGHYWTVTG